MTDFDWKRASGVFAAGYFKQFTDPYLKEALKKHQVAAALESHPVMRVGGQALLHASRSYVDQKLDGKTPISAFFKTALLDLAGELASQMSQSASEELNRLSGAANPAPVQKVASRLLALDEAMRTRLLMALGEMEEKDRAAFLGYVESASQAEFEQFAALAPEAQLVLLSLHRLGREG